MKLELASPGGTEELGEVCRGQVPVAQGSAPVLKSKSLNRALGVSSRDFQFELGAEAKKCNGQSGRDGCISRSQGCCGEHMAKCTCEAMSFRRRNPTERL